MQRLFVTKDSILWMVYPILLFSFSISNEFSLTFFSNMLASSTGLFKVSAKAAFKKRMDLTVLHTQSECAWIRRFQTLLQALTTLCLVEGKVVNESDCSETWYCLGHLEQDSKHLHTTIKAPGYSTVYQ